MSELPDTQDMVEVDSAGCEKGEIERPAQLYMGRNEVELKIPNAPYSFLRSDTVVGLENKR